MTNMTTKYLGMELKNPAVVSACPLCEKVDNIRRMEDAGAAAVVLHSLFEEQINVETEELDTFLDMGTESFAEALNYFPDMANYKLGPEEYLDHIRACKEAVDIPIIASLNGVSKGGWIDYAKKMEEAGADALELNIYLVPTNPETSGVDIETIYCDLLREVKLAIGIPVAAKIGPYFSSMANMAWRLDRANADAIVLFNRFYQPDFDLEQLEVTPNLQLSTSNELRLRLRWAAILHHQIKSDIAITGGIHNASDMLKAMMAGAKVGMMTSALLRNGIGHLRTVLSDMAAWMEEKEYESVEQMQGSLGLRAVENPAAFERANYIHVLSSYSPVTS